MADKIKSTERLFTMVYNDFFRMPKNVLTHFDKMVFIAIKSHAGISGSSFPSIDLLSRETGISRQWIQESIKHLRELGFLRVERRKYNNGNLYVIYETEEMCKAGSVEEVKKAAEKSEEEKAIETLLRLGYTVTPPPETEKEKDQSDAPTSDRSGDKVKFDSLSGSNHNLKHAKLQEGNEKYPLDQIKSMMNYELMLEENPDQREYIDSAMHVVYEAVNTSKPTLRVGKENRPSSVVISQLLKLDHIQIMDVLDSVLEAKASTTPQGEPIRVPQAYLLTALYNAVTQNLKTASRAAYDMAHWQDKDKTPPEKKKPPEDVYDNF